jgi:GNAT superfamily N-acetyltransferase
MIEYIPSCEGIEPSHLQGFFDGWPRRPSPEMHLRAMQGSDAVILARDDETGEIIGFVTALTDGVMSAFIPLLEVREAYRHRGIGKELMRRILERFEGLYMIDLCCDPELQPFYAPLGMHPSKGMLIRNPGCLDSIPSGREDGTEVSP